MWRGAIFQIKKQHTNQDINCLVFHPICALPPPCRMFVKTPPRRHLSNQLSPGKIFSSVEHHVFEFSTSEIQRRHRLLWRCHNVFPGKTETSLRKLSLLFESRRIKTVRFRAREFRTGRKKSCCAKFDSYGKALSLDRCARVEPEWFGEKVLASATRSRVVGDSSVKYMGRSWQVWWFT